MTTAEIITVAVVVLSCITTVISVVVITSAVRRELERVTEKSRRDTVEALQGSISQLSSILTETQRLTAASQDRRLAELTERLDRSQEQLSKAMGESLNRMDERIRNMSEQNDKSLERMRNTVDEKLQKTLDERIGQSFKQVSERLEQVSKGLGEMQSLASGVGDLKKVLTNVKSRGVLGEIQLGAILEQILAPEQYDTNVITKPGSNNRVEYAVKIPTEDGCTVYIPIDSKFPGDTYANLRDAYESDDPKAINEAFSKLATVIKNEARDIATKYIDPPNTADFGIMFLPFEGLYAEVVNRGLMETIQREYHVSVAGPSTMAAVLNSLRMGFKTFAIQKRSGEVWRVLGAVKTEFANFAKALNSAQRKVISANDELDALIHTRTNVMQRKLREVESINAEESAQILQISEDGSLPSHEEDEENE